MEKSKQNIDWSLLSTNAWECRENASILGKTKVGAALLTEDGKIFSGCNIEQLYRNHDVHAEVNAIANMISHGSKKLVAILIVAERNNFTPCGSCLDWIFQFGGPETYVAFQNSPYVDIVKYQAKDLMPHYPH
jgi:cytidine deaminase